MSGDVFSFGSRVREKRATLGLTLQQLAERSGVSASMLSVVERDAKSPTLRVANQIAEGLDCGLAELLDEGHGADPELDIVRRSQASVLIDGESGVARHGLSPLLAGSDIDVTWFELPGAATAGPFEHRRPDLYECVVVLKGRLELWLGDSSHEMRRGDAATYRADRPHRFVNALGTRCEYIHVAATKR